MARDGCGATARPLDKHLPRTAALVSRQHGRSDVAKSVTVSSADDDAAVPPGAAVQGVDGKVTGMKGPIKVAAKGTIQEDKDTKVAAQPTRTESITDATTAARRSSAAYGVTYKPRSAGLKGLNMQWGAIDKHNKTQQNRGKKKRRVQVAYYNERQQSTCASASSTTPLRRRCLRRKSCRRRHWHPSRQTDRG